MRLTIGSYWRPSGKDIHKRQDAKDSDDWGVRPDPGQEVHLTNQQFETVLLARRRRDITPLAKLLEALADRPAELDLSSPSSPELPVEPSDDNEPSSSNPPVPVPSSDSDTEPSAAEKTDQEAAANALQDPATIDPQLRQAIQTLQAEIARGL
jgi:carboxyl-terminal processing protease